MWCGVVQWSVIYVKWCDVVYSDRLEGVDGQGVVRNKHSRGYDARPSDKRWIMMVASVEVNQSVCSEKVGTEAE